MIREQHGDFFHTCACGMPAANTIGYLIPCHRVIREGGEAGSYRWRPERKLAILGWERCGRGSARAKVSPGRTACSKWCVAMSSRSSSHPCSIWLARPNGRTGLLGPRHSREGGNPGVANCVDSRVRGNGGLPTTIPPSATAGSSAGRPCR
ncbi:MAG: MGMT family protein [Rhodocyclaceae bacterium]|nr:MGMT family protein [Rhodocyclaceae bacterium]